MPMTSFKNKVVVVTGAASGIGLAISKRFARGGARLGLLDMDAVQLKSVEKMLNDIGTTCLGVSCDISEKAACEAAIRQILNRFGGIDVLVNNAGITQRSAFVDTDIGVLKR